MDFLDPRKQRSYRIRLMIGYGLVTVAIALSTVILVYGAYGYSINTKTGDIVQNGLLFVDSKPGGADIYLDGTFQRSTTSARLILPAKTYTLTLKKTAYRDWQRTFVLNEHSIGRYVYPFLFPVELNGAPLKTYSRAPKLMSQSPDQRWLLVEQADSSAQIVSFEEYDTRDVAKASRIINLPSVVLTNYDQAHSSLETVEWSSDSNHFLLKHSTQSSSEFIIVDRLEPSKSININRLFKVVPYQVTLRDKKVEQLYVFDQAASSLQVADIARAVVHPPFLKDILAFKAYGSNLLTYITAVGAPPGQVVARIWDQGKTYPLHNFPSGSKYLIDAAQFQGHWYYIAGSNTSQRINIYKDPLNGLKNPAVTKAIPLISLNNAGVTEVSFSQNTRFIAAQAAQKFAVYDIEEQNSYNYSVSAVLDSAMHWMDGHRLIGVSSGNIQIVDFDGTNPQQLVHTLFNQAGYFDRSFNHLFTLVATPGSGSVALQNIELRAGVDLPKP